jgi:FtsP/CotA-like multicopper oxidase with cupredoxin domain
VRARVLACVAAGVASVALVLVAAAMPGRAAERTYYIAADAVRWNFAPAGFDQILDKPLPPDPPPQLGWTYRKVVYRQYTDATFAHVAPRRKDDSLGLLGPTIHAEVGDTVRVIFKNNSPIAVDMRPTGLLAPPQGAVAPGARRTYWWAVPDRAGPGPADVSSVAWTYGSDIAEQRDVNTGMFGAIIVTRRGMARADGSPTDVDREIVSAFLEIDESQSRLVKVNVADRTINPRRAPIINPAFRFFNQFWTIDGYVYGNMPMPVMRRGERVRWYLLTAFSDFDAHTPHWHGQTVIVGGMRTDLVPLVDTDRVVADMMPDNPGVWLFHCHVNFHLALGMEARFRVLP